MSRISSNNKQTAAAILEKSLHRKQQAGRCAGLLIERPVVKQSRGRKE